MSTTPIFAAPLDYVFGPCVSVDATDADRDSPPTECPICGGPVGHRVDCGNWRISDSGDQERLLEAYGLEVPEGTWVLWAHLNVECLDVHGCGWEWKPILA